MSDDFGTFNLDELQNEGERLQTKAQGGENGGFTSQVIQIPDPKPGQATVFPVRILPPMKGHKLFQYNRIHYINGRNIHCPRPIVNGKFDRNTPCVICDYYNSLYRRKDALLEKGDTEGAKKCEAEARSIKPVERYYYNAIVRKEVDEAGERLNVGPKILSVGKVLHQMIIRAIIGDATEAALGDVTHPKNGWDFVIMKEMRGVGREAYPNYDRSKFARDASPAGTPEEIQKWVTNLIDLTTLRMVPEVKALEYELAVHRGLIEDEKKKEAFNVDAFDKKFKGNGTSVSVSTSVASMNTDEALAAAVGSAEDVLSTPPEADVNISSAEFLAELQNMGESVTTG
jgi:hypothetical protein